MKIFWFVVINITSYLFFFLFSILFWTDWDASSPRIEAASMSGDGRRTIHRETGSGGWPNGLTVDYLERRILWIDARYVRYTEHPIPHPSFITSSKASISKFYFLSEISSVTLMQR